MSPYGVTRPQWVNTSCFYWNNKLKKTKKKQYFLWRCFYLLGYFNRDNRVVLAASFISWHWLEQKTNIHDDVMTWKHSPHDMSYVRGIHQSLAVSPHKPAMWTSTCFCCYPEQAVKQRVKLLVIQGNITPMWHHCKVMLKIKILFVGPYLSSTMRSSSTVMSQVQLARWW